MALSINWHHVRDKSIRKMPMHSLFVSSAEIACSASVLASGQPVLQSLGDTCDNQLAKSKNGVKTWPVDQEQFNHLQIFP